MKVLLVGATGRVGGPILSELRSRGHELVALVRDPKQVAPGVQAVAGDVFLEGVVESAAVGCEVLVTAVALRDASQHDRTPLELTHRLAAAAVASGCRWISVGGAGSLEVAPGVQLVDTPQFPAAAHAESAGFRDALDYLRRSAPPELAWTVVSPPMEILIDGARTGRYRIATDVLIRDEQGRSAISARDLAAAVVDEVEVAHHARDRFTVGY